MKEYRLVLYFEKLIIFAINININHIFIIYLYLFILNFFLNNKYDINFVLNLNLF